MFERLVFSEPAGGAAALLQIAFSAAFFTMYVSYGLVAGSGSVAALILRAGFLLSGVAELLPVDRRLESSLLRITAYGLLAGVVAIVLVTPDIVIG